MSYRTILVHVDGSGRAQERINIAAQLALTNHAHLIGAAMTGISRALYPSGILDTTAIDFAAILDVLREQAEHALVTFDTLAQQIGVPSFERQLLDDEAGDGMSLQARYCDLVVIGQTDPNDASPVVASDFPENVVMRSGRPVLIIPYAGHFETVGKRPLIAWDASIAAARAVANALPFLQRADKVDVLVVNPEKYADVHGDMPGADIARYLVRHHVNVNVTQQNVTIPVADALFALSTDISADLIVMGGYGHTRFRELLLGGVTRTVLTAMTVPVLMSH
jgi:nucleotide-binding universal stress UspA family protein